MTGINWLLFIIGITLGAIGQRWLTSLGRPSQSNAEHQIENTPVAAEIPIASETPSAPTPNQSGGDADAHGEGQDELWLAYIRALERAQFQGGFLARTAHELRSPLSSLMGLQQLILTDLCDSPEEERQCVAQSYEAAQNLLSLMNRLISISKLEQGSQRLDIQPIAVDVFLEELQTLVELQMADRNVRFHVDLPAQSTYIKGDYNSMQLFWMMLLETSIAQNAQELAVSINIQPEGTSLLLWMDEPWKDWQEAIQPLTEAISRAQQPDYSSTASEPAASGMTTEVLEAVEASKAANTTPLSQLKHQLRQHPEQPFIPHRLSPSMVLLVCQFIAELNGGAFQLVSEEMVAKQTVSQDSSANSSTEEQIADAWGGANWRGRLKPCLECRLQTGL